MIKPQRMQAGDHVRVIAPSTTIAIIGDEGRAIANRRFAEMGLTLSFGEHVEECDEFWSTSIEHRVADLHAAFADPDVDAIMTVIGGYNSNQLLPYLDWDLIAANPKILCGYSDITALSGAIYAKTGLVTFSGPHWSTFGMEQHLEQTLAWFRATLFDGGVKHLEPAATWSDDAWYQDQVNRTIEDNSGRWILQPGSGTGRLIGGNLCTLNLLQGTEYMPELAGAVVFVEDDFESDVYAFNRDLTSLTQQPGFDQVNGLLIGRFQRSNEMTQETLGAIVGSKQELAGMPVVANMDFGHTNPLMTLPVGGQAVIDASGTTTSFAISDYLRERS